jgi:hypothetical protein
MSDSNSRPGTRSQLFYIRCAPRWLAGGVPGASMQAAQARYRTAEANLSQAASRASLADLLGVMRQRTTPTAQGP